MVNIYVIENNINNKLYVGRTSQTLNKRILKFNFGPTWSEVKYKIN